MKYVLKIENVSLSVARQIFFRIPRPQDPTLFFEYIKLVDVNKLQILLYFVFRNELDNCANVSKPCLKYNHDNKCYFGCKQSGDE